MRIKDCCEKQKETEAMSPMILARFPEDFVCYFSLYLK